jgi:hypothetical protein
MRKFLGFITQLSEETGTFVVVECLSKNYNTCAELGVDEMYGMIAVEVKDRNPKIKWEVVGMYRSPKEGMRYETNVVAWRKFGNVLRKQSSRVSIVLSHIKFLEKS